MRCFKCGKYSFGNGETCHVETLLTISDDKPDKSISIMLCDNCKKQKTLAGEQTK